MKIGRRMWRAMLIASAGAGALSGCYYDPYLGYYHAGPPYPWGYGPYSYGNGYGYQPGSPPPPAGTAPNGAAPANLPPGPAGYGAAPPTPYGTAPPTPYGTAPPTPYGTAPPTPYGAASPGAYGPAPLTPYGAVPPADEPVQRTPLPQFTQ